MARRHEKRASKIWDSVTGGLLWVGGWEDAKSGLDGWAELIINCANEDYAPVLDQEVLLRVARLPKPRNGLFHSGLLPSDFVDLV